MNSPAVTVTITDPSLVAKLRTCSAIQRERVIQAAVAATNEVWPAIQVPGPLRMAMPTPYSQWLFSEGELTLRIRNSIPEGLWQLFVSMLRQEFKPRRQQPTIDLASQINKRRSLRSASV